MASTTLSSRTPLVQAPVFARDVKELQTVISAQDVEERALKIRLAEGTREVAFLRKRLRDSTEELEVTAEAALNAAERLEAHQGRQGLVLAAEAERCSAENAAIEDELRRMEQLLYERDQEIARLRRTHENLQTSRLQGELELTGMAMAHEKASSEVRAFGAGVQELRERLRDGGKGLGKGGPSQLEASRMGDLAQEFHAKQEERAALQMKADAATAEAQRREAELMAMKEEVRVLSLDLRRKQEIVENQDHKLVREAATIRAQCDELRKALHNEQRDAAGIDQRAVLQERCGAEAEGVRREVQTILQTVRGLASTLRARGLAVCSPQVANDPVDVAMHTFLRASGFPGTSGGALPSSTPMGAMNGLLPTAPGNIFLPPVVWRLLPGEYLIDDDRVTIAMQEGHLIVHDPRTGRRVNIREFMSFEASRVQMDFAGAHGATH
jgi:predicted  nucleic acid-binding Zn-ribbon protein